MAMNATLSVGVMASLFMRAQAAGKWPLLTPCRRYRRADLVACRRELARPPTASCSVLSGAAERFGGYPALLEIAPQRIDRAGTLGEGDIGIWPDQIERVLREAGRPVFRPPREYMQRQA